METKKTDVNQQYGSSSPIKQTFNVWKRTAPQRGYYRTFVFTPSNHSRDKLNNHLHVSDSQDTSTIRRRPCRSGHITYLTVFVEFSWCWIHLYLEVFRKTTNCKAKYISSIWYSDTPRTIVPTMMSNEDKESSKIITVQKWSSSTVRGKKCVDVGADHFNPDRARKKQMWCTFLPNVPDCSNVRDL